MMWTFNTEVGVKMQELQNQVQKVGEEIQAISALQKEFDSIHDKFSDLYGNKYGINKRKVKRRIDRVDLERMMHLIRAEDAQPQKSGIFGLGGLKKEDYYVFTDKLNLVESNLEFLVEDWKSYIAEKVTEFNAFLDEYEQEHCERVGLYKEMEAQVEYNKPSGDELKSLLLGTVAVNLPRAHCIGDVCRNNEFSFFDGRSINVLMQMPLDELTSCYIQYENDAQLDKAHQWIRALYKQMLCGISSFHSELLYLDGLHNASGLKEFLQLQSIKEDYVSDISPQLLEGGARILKVRREREGIQQELKELELYMGTVTDMVQGASSFAEYNENYNQKIPYRFIVLEGMDAYVDVVFLRKLLTNGAACGIIVIYLQDARLLISNEIGARRENAEVQKLFFDLPKVFLTGNGISLELSQRKYVCELLTIETSQEKYVSDILKKLGTQKVVDNNFATCFPEDYQWGRYTSTIKLPDGKAKGRILMPFALNKRGNIIEMELGSADYAHGLLSGGTGSGKSTMLHMLICSVVMNYHPKDVEIWLADYKQTEMSVYITHKPPHVKFIGIERNEEFSFSLIDLIFNEYERRERLFVECGVRNIDAYKEKYGMNSLPRILVIIDEFHLMAQQVAENYAYSLKLENILSEARTAGIACLFADQAVSVGLKGLTDKGKKQMKQRLAMASDKEEMSITLGTKVSETDAALQTGEVVQKKLNIKANSAGEEIRETVLELNKVIFISDEEREEVTEKAISLYGTGDSPIIVDGSKPEKIDWEIAENYEKKVEDGRETFFLHMGKPSNFDACYAIPLIRDYGQNVICVHDKCNLQKRILMNAIKSFLRTSESNVYILADENDPLYLSVRNELQELRRIYSNVVIATTMEKVCKHILALSESMVARRKRLSKEVDLVIWLGLDSMLREFQYYDDLPQERKNASSNNPKLDKMQEELNLKMAALFGGELQSVSVSYRAEDDEGELFNATEQVSDLIREGAKRGIFQFVFISNLLAIRNQRALKLDQFVYKMSGYLNRDNSMEFYGGSKFMGSMSEKEDNISFVCYDGRRSRFFVPYVE